MGRLSLPDDYSRRIRSMKIDIKKFSYMSLTIMLFLLIGLKPVYANTAPYTTLTEDYRECCK